MSSNRMTNLSVGAAGADVISNTAVNTGKWGALQVLEDAVIDNITVAKVTNTAALEGPSLSQGFTFWGEINSIELTSGKVIMYRR